MNQSGNDKHYYRIMLDAVPLPILLVDDDVEIIDLNSAAEEMLAKTKSSVLKKRGGDVIQCIHSFEDPRGCGSSPSCQDCLIRNSVSETATGKSVQRRYTKMETVSDTGSETREYLITTSPVDIGGERRTLLMFEDISELTQLRSLIPMCANCKRIRNDKQYWQTVEVYLRQYHGLNVSHGLCEDCLRTLYPEISEKILNRERTP